MTQQPAKRPSKRAPAQPSPQVLEAQPGGVDPPAPPVDEPPAAHVVQALSRVIRDMGGIPKLTKEQRRAMGMFVPDGEAGVPYAYRGIDQIAAAAQPLLGRHQVVIAPVSIESRDVEIQLNSRPWVDRHVKVVWAVMGPGGVDDRFLAESEGIGRDNSDKAASKASTNAYKNVLLRLLCIGDPQDDPEHEKQISTGEQARPSDEDVAEFQRAKAETDELIEALKAAPEPAKEAMKAWAKERRGSLNGNVLLDDPGWRAEVAAELRAAKERMPQREGTTAAIERANQIAEQALATARARAGAPPPELGSIEAEVEQELFGGGDQS